MDKQSINKNRIADALIDLLQDKTIEAVTVTQIVEKAGVGKSTFYRTFSDVYEVFDFLFCDFCDRCLTVLNNVFLYKNVPQILKEKTAAFPAKEVMKLFHLLPKDTVLMHYLFRTNNIRLFKLLIDRFQLLTVSLAEQAGLDTQKSAFFARFIADGTVFSMLESYRRNETIDTDSILFLLSLDISPLFQGGKGL